MERGGKIRDQDGGNDSDGPQSKMSEAAELQGD